MVDPTAIISMVVGFIGVALAAQSMRVSVKGQRDLADRLRSLDESIGQRDKRLLDYLGRLQDRLDSLDKSIENRESLLSNYLNGLQERLVNYLQRLQARLDIVDASAALWNHERAPSYLAQVMWSAYPRFISINSGAKGYTVTVTKEGKELVAAIDKHLLKRVLDKQQASQKKLSSAQIIREQDLRELQMAVDRYNSNHRETVVDLHTVIGLLNAELGGTIDSGTTTTSL